MLDNAGKITAELAKRKADAEYQKFRERTRTAFSPVDQHFLQTLEQSVEKLEQSGPTS